jgi:radical SAM superfamily enzyme YgiQ (UPF0313 family)
MNVTFITPAPFFRRLPVYRWGCDVYGHPDSITGPLILAGIVRRAGHEVEAYEELNGSFDYDRLLQRTDVLCLYTMTSNAKRAYDIADRFRAEGHARVIIGGIHASALPEEALQHADQVMVGEGERAILDCVEGRIAQRIVHPQPPCNLDEVPFPDYSVLKTPCEAADILTTRGCPFSCTFCTTSRMFHPYRQRSVDNVIEEIRRYKNMGFEYMNFEDDNFTADKERAKEICRRMIAEGLTFKQTFFFGRTDMANDPELLDLLAQAHLTRVLIGIESLNQDSLDAIDKHQTIDDIRRAGIACRDHGIEVIASIVLGIDTDGPDDLARTTEFAKSIDAYQLQPAVLMPFPGTPVYESLKRDGRMILSGEEHDASDWTAFDMMNCTFQPRRMSPWKLQMSFCDMARKFYTRRSAVRIGILFGPEYGWRRYGLALMAQWGTLATWAAGTFAKGTSYWRVKHAGWMYADDPANEHRSEPEESSETAADPHAPAAVFSLPDALRAAEKRLAEDRRIVRRRRRVQREERLRPDPFAGVPKRPMPSERAIIPLKMLGIAEMALPVVAAIRLARRHRHA